VPAFAVRAAMSSDSPNGETYESRLAKVRTERELSEIYEDLIGTHPMGPAPARLANPVHTGGPMQVEHRLRAELRAQARLSVGRVASVRHAVFTPPRGMYFGIAHLLAYPASYEPPPLPLRGLQCRFLRQPQCRASSRP
jgi:hypothetical protein